MTARVLVTGGGGQLASALARSRPGTVATMGRPVFDFDRPETIGAVLRTRAPALVVNAAAWTAVDAAEASPEAAERANHTGPAHLAALCRDMGIPLVHISTDYVFDGLKGAPYLESDATNPTCVYGATKLAGEIAVRRAHPDAVILRTSWVYARAGKNFVLTMLNAAKRMPVLRVVSDQVGCPTNADDLADATLAVCDRLLADPQRSGAVREGDSGLGGIYHAAGHGQTSWHGFALEIFRIAAGHGWPNPEVQAIATEAWPTPARRPPDSRLACDRLAEMFGVRLPRWETSLGRAIDDICSAGAFVPGAG